MKLCGKRSTTVPGHFDHSQRCADVQTPQDQGQGQGCVREHADTNPEPEKQCGVCAQLQETAENCVANAKMNPNPEFQKHADVCVAKIAKNAKCGKCKTCLLKIHSKMKCAAMCVSGSAVHLHLSWFRKTVL